MTKRKGQKRGDSVCFWVKNNMGVRVRVSANKTLCLYFTVYTFRAQGGVGGKNGQIQG